MADIRDERGNPIYLADEQGKPAQLVDEFGNAMHLTGVATTVPHLKESSYTGPHPITAPITTTDTPHHAQPISVSHNPLENKGISSSNSVRFIYLIRTVWRLVAWYEVSTNHINHPIRLYVDGRIWSRITTRSYCNG